MKTDDISSIVDRAVTEFGRVDILVNNAGIIRRNDALEFSEQDWDDVMDINVKSVFFLSQAVAKQFIAQAPAGRSSTWHLCSLSKAVFECLLIQHRKVALWGLPA